ncbi:ATPase, T2SS/T4P/T4SS family [Tunturiibacter gelidoferens]|uniref:Tfp pilus assembly ATPase PilU n=1 Tax=Tunturiibacter gelidiferens TaxID=3069689 RepID=A0A9X0QAI5_9BACT|nr:ATPase, T2SS/T4P/T4SS family [Edaphobacter lichenicola]MBB5327001.1 Tfp pilus assembly ATPase PilU [Edaphobacter lichenicola]
MNTLRRDHIITIEDPIEYQHLNRSSLVEQIELGRDTHDFAHAVRSVLRQDPDVIMIGEMRDSDTMAAALTAAETVTWFCRRYILTMRRRQSRAFWTRFLRGISRRFDSSFRWRCLL